MVVLFKIKMKNESGAIQRPACGRSQKPDWSRASSLWQAAVSSHRSIQYGDAVIGNNRKSTNKEDLTPISPY